MGLPLAGDVVSRQRRFVGWFMFDFRLLDDRPPAQLAAESLNVFEVRNSTWAQELIRGSAIAAHLVPVRNRYWLAGPGWLQWPIVIGPDMRRDLSKFQFDPIQYAREGTPR